MASDEHSIVGIMSTQQGMQAAAEWQLQAAGSTICETPLPTMSKFSEAGLQPDNYYTAADMHQHMLTVSAQYSTAQTACTSLGADIH